MVKSVISVVNGRPQSSPSSGYSTNSNKGVAPMNEGQNSNSNSVGGPQRSNSLQTAPSGGNVGMNSGPRLGNSQISNTSGFRTANSGGGSTARRKVGQAAESRLEENSHTQSKTTFRTAYTPQTMQRNILASAAEKRQELVPKELLNQYKKNVQNLGSNMPRNVGSEISRILKSKNVTVETFNRLNKLLNNAKSRRAAESARARQGTRGKSVKTIGVTSSKERMKSDAKQLRSQWRQDVLNSARTTNAALQKKIKQLTIPTMKKILENKGKSSTLGISREPYIQAIINMGGLTNQELRSAIQGQKTVTPGQPKSKRLRTATPGPGTLKTAPQAYIEFQKQKQKLKNNVKRRNNITNIQKNTLLKIINGLRNLKHFNINDEIKLNVTRKELDQLVSDSKLNNKKKRQLSNRIMSGSKSNLNMLRQEINNVLNPKKMKARALVKLYKSKLTDSNKISKAIEDTIIDQITKYNITTGRMSLKSVIGSDTFVNLLLIMWLDGIHDKYITMTFKDWLEHPSIQSTFPLAGYSSSPMFIFLKNLRIKKITKHTKNSETPLHKRLQIFNKVEKMTINSEQLENVLNGYLTWIMDKEKNMLRNKPQSTSTFTEPFINNLGFSPDSKFVSFSTGWEKNFKIFLVEKYTKKNNIKQNVGQVNAKNDKNIFLLAIDQEYSTRQERPLTNMILKSGKSVQSLVTYGQAFDPGSTMLPEGIVPDLHGITVDVLNPEKQNSEPQQAMFSPTPWYYLEEYKFSMKVGGVEVMKIEFDPHKSELSLNNKPLSLNITAGKAGKANDPFFQLGKYFGDGLQYFIASALTKFTKLNPIDIQLVGNNRKTRFHPFLGSGDGMALFGYDFVCTKLYKSTAPNMVIDFSKQSNPIAYIVNFPNKAFEIKMVPPENRKYINIENVNYNQNRQTQQVQTSNKGNQQQGNNNSTVQSKRI